MASPLASGISAVWNEVTPTVDHGVEAIVNLNGPAMGAGVMARSSPTASDCYYLEVISDPLTAEIDEYGIYRRKDGVYTPLWTDTLTLVTASGVMATPPSGSDVRVRLETETFDDIVHLSAWAGNTDTNFTRLALITDTHVDRIKDNLYVGVMAATPSGSQVSWDGFRFYTPYEHAYHDSVAGKSWSAGTETEPCSSIQNLIKSLKTSKSYNGATSIRVRENDAVTKLRIDHPRHKGTSWADPGLYVTGYKNRPSLTALEQSLLEVTDYADFIWVKGLHALTDTYGGPGKMFDYNNKHLRLTSISATLGTAYQTQEYNEFAVGGASPSGESSELWCEYSFVDILGGTRSKAVFTTEADPSGLASPYPPPTTLKLSRVVVRGDAERVVSLHGSGTIDNLDLDHLTLVDTGGTGDPSATERIHEGIAASGVINFGVDPTFKNSIIASINTNELQYGINIGIDHKFITDRNMYWNIEAKERNISHPTNIINNENPLFQDETATYEWIQSAIAEHEVDGIILPKDWRPMNVVARKTADDGTDLGALLVALLPPTQQPVVSSVLVEQLLENLRPLYTTLSNYRYRYPMSSQQWELAFSQIYKELVNLLGIEFVDQDYTRLGYINTTIKYLDEAAERQFRYVEADTTNRYPLISTQTEIFSSGNYIGFFTDMDNAINLVDSLYREWN